MLTSMLIQTMGKESKSQSSLNDSKLSDIAQLLETTEVDFVYKE